jgi:hypothetical protein
LESICTNYINYATRPGASARRAARPRLVAPLVVDNSASRRLVVDYFISSICVISFVISLQSIIDHEREMQKFLKKVVTNYRAAGSIRPCEIEGEEIVAAAAAARRSTPPPTCRRACRSQLVAALGKSGFAALSRVAVDTSTARGLGRFCLVVVGH